MYGIRNLKTTANNKLVLEVSNSSADSARKTGDEIEHDGIRYIVTGTGKAFKVGPRDTRIYLYIRRADGQPKPDLLSSYKARYGTSERAWEEEDEQAWAVLREYELGQAVTPDLPKYEPETKSDLGE